MSEYSSKRPGGVNAIINDERYRSVFYQVVVFGLFIWAVFSLIENTQINMATRKMAVGFDFLKNSAGFAVAWTPLDYKPSDSYFMVYWVGIINTLILAGISIVLATFLGFVVGILRLSRNWLERTNRVLVCRSFTKHPAVITNNILVSRCFCKLTSTQTVYRDIWF